MSGTTLRREPIRKEKKVIGYETTIHLEVGGCIRFPEKLPDMGIDHNTVTIDE